MTGLYQQVVQLLAKLHGECVTPEERDQAKPALLAMDHQQLIPVLKEVIRNERDADIVYDAANLLDDIDRAEAGEFLIPILNNPEYDEVRWGFCGLLSVCGGEKAVLPLTEVLLNDSVPEARLMAAFALEKIGDERVIPALEWAVEHDQGEDYEGRPVSWGAAQAIEEIWKRLAES